ncbi:SRPBCC family protein [Hydrogenophaga sp. OTU3427]|uniref:SRPBCC family protein n=1 Tax=Hydrogenophaga sp. OTU3427 TaxID=3043856 RepID=UPI00313C9575
MNATHVHNLFGSLGPQAELRLERLLPGPIERVWDWLTDSDLRRRWLAAGVMELREGAEFELVWRNDELTDPPGQRPEGFGEEHRMRSRITHVKAPHRLGFTWGEASHVCFELETVGQQVRLTIVHQGAPNRDVLLNVSAGWHAHLDVLSARLGGDTPAPHWDNWVALRVAYDQRFQPV